MKKYTVISMVFALALIGLTQNAQTVRAEAEGTVPSVIGSNVSENTAVSAGTNANESGAIIPNTGNTNANESGQIIPNVGGTNANESGVIVPNVGGSNADESGTTPVPPVVPPVTPPGGGGGSGGGSSFGASSGGSSNGGSALLANTTAPAGFVLSASCPLITNYLKVGAINDAAQVSKLQIFLKNVEKLNVDVNGIFDQKTDDAVKAFQIKYLASILGPWDATRATGFVYITTTKKINEIACASAFTLSADEQAIINEYKSRGTATEPEAVIGQAEQTVPTASSTLEVGTTDTNENVAAVGEASILSRFWSYIKNLFR